MLFRILLDFRMLSDLSPGDKLSLKGKIFELQKKLQIIDQRNKQDGEFSYKPKLFSYDLPDREDNVLESINKAEIIRKVWFDIFVFELLVSKHLLTFLCLDLVVFCTSFFSPIHHSNARKCFMPLPSSMMEKNVHLLLLLQKNQRNCPRLTTDR